MNLAHVSPSWSAWHSLYAEWQAKDRVPLSLILAFSYVFTNAQFWVQRSELGVAARWETTGLFRYLQLTHAVRKMSARLARMLPALGMDALSSPTRTVV